MRVALYCRVSTEEQAKYGLSIQAQLNELQEYAKTHKYTIVGEYLDEGVSGGRLDRPALNRLLDDVKENKIDLILFAKLDRWFRSVAHYYKIEEVLEQYNVKWKTVEEEYETETSSGKFKVNIMLSVSQQFKDATSERIRTVFDYKVFQQGKSPNNCCNKIYGYDTVNGTYVINEQEAKNVKLIFEKFYTTQSLSETMDYFNENFGKLTNASIKTMLKRIIYIGKYEYKGHIFDNFYPRILTDEEFYKAQKVFEHNCKKYISNETGISRTYIFSSLLTCPECGGKLNGIATGSGSNRKNRVKYYRCKRHYINHICKNNRLYPEYKIEKQLLNYLPNMLKKCKFSTKEKELEYIDNTKTIKTKMERLQRIYVDGLIDLDNYHKQYNELKLKLDKIKPIVKTNSKTKQEIKDLLSLYDEFTEENKRLFWRSIPFDIIIKNDIFYLKNKLD